MSLQTNDKNVAHKDTHEQLAALMTPLDEVKVTTHHTTPHHANTPRPSYQLLTSRIRTAGPSMHYTPKVPKNNCQFQNKSMLSWETALVSALTSRRLRRAVQVAEARRVASSALLQSTPLHRRHASDTTKHELPRTHSTRLICLHHVLQLSMA